MIADAIQTSSLEPALLAFPPGPRLEGIIIDVTAKFIAAREQTAVVAVFSKNRTLRITRLIPHLLKPDTGIQIITTNYDRLVEIGVEEAGVGVDTMFVGDFSGRLNEAEARYSHCRDAKLINRNVVRLIYRSRAVVSKPHGSLDWYIRNGAPVRFGGELPGVPRLIVPPGRNKFRAGYEQPFDRQRERANNAIDRASRFLIIGYGFADEHLETHLTPALRNGKPALIITRDLSANAYALALSQDNITAIDRIDDITTRLIMGRKALTLPGPPIWDLNAFVDEVLEP